MKITWYGTASLKFEGQNTTLHFDPFYPMNIRISSMINWPEVVSSDILVTHGHLDHTMDIPKLMLDPAVNLYCAAPLAGRLAASGARPEQIQVIEAGDRFSIGDCVLTVLPSRHSFADWRLRMKTLVNPRILAYPLQFYQLVKAHRSHPCGPVFAYDLTMDGVRVVHIGSMGLDPDFEYPTGVDILTLPYQGCSDLVEQALHIISRIGPKAILLHHFDDSFPPISRYIDPDPLVKAMHRCFPEVRLVIPEHAKTLLLPLEQPA